MRSAAGVAGRVVALSDRRLGYLYGRSYLERADAVAIGPDLPLRRGVAEPVDGAMRMPSTLPLTQLDFIYYRGLQMLRQFVPQKTTLESSTGIRSWARLSDHLPLVADFVLE